MNDLPTHSKCLDPADYALLEPEVGFFRNLRHDLREVQVDFAHPHRYWEYALALRVALRLGAPTVLDAGGGAGLFSAGAAKCGFDVTHLEVGDYKGIIGQHARVIDRSIRCVNRHLEDHIGSAPYGLVACLSVIEHVLDDINFFDRACSLVGRWGNLVLTTDFHPSGQPQVEGHLRTYNQESLAALVDHAAKHDLRPWRGLPDWSGFAPHVYGYSFASLVLGREPL